MKVSPYTDSVWELKGDSCDACLAPLLSTQSTPLPPFSTILAAQLSCFLAPSPKTMSLRCVWDGVVQGESRKGCRKSFEGVF